jgi:uncharacterized protein (TIGR01244 family)
MPTHTIYNYRKVNDQLITGGQPKEEQLKAAAEEGFKTVINLAPITSQSALPDEAGLVKSLGLNYHYIPVDWDNPQESDFATFESALKQASAEKTFIHCAANFRVTAFYSLYAIKNLGWSEAQADEFRASIWKGIDYPVWEKFIGEMKSKIAHQS